MSATIVLYQLANAKFQNKGLYSISHTECKKMTDEEFEALWETRHIDRFTDNQPHVLVDLTYYKQCYGNSRGWKRVREKFNSLPVQSGIVNASKSIHHYIVADEIASYSGKELNRRYYKKDTWLILCVKKEEVELCFKKYATKEMHCILQDILDKWNDKSFLIISY